MTTQQKSQAEETMHKAWDAIWLPTLSTLPDHFTNDAEISGFSPPKQCTWKGMDAIKAHFLEIHPIVKPDSFDILNLDIAIPSSSSSEESTYYATWRASFTVSLPGQDPSTMPGNGIVKCVVREGKVAVWTMFEDPTPFVAMAMGGMGGEGGKGGE